MHRNSRPSHITQRILGWNNDVKAPHDERNILENILHLSITHHIYVSTFSFHISDVLNPCDEKIAYDFHFTSLLPLSSEECNTWYKGCMLCTNMVTTICGIFLKILLLFYLFYEAHLISHFMYEIFDAEMRYEEGLQWDDTYLDIFRYILHSFQNVHHSSKFKG